MITVIAEKPSVAKDLATFLKADKKENGYFHGNGYYVTYAFGHLVSLAAPEAYGYLSFDRSVLPMMPDKFKLEIVKELKNNKRVESKSAAIQLNIIKKLINQSSSIIVATDAGREGELIFRNIYNYLKSDKPFQRLWISSLTNSAIAEGFKNLLPGNKFDNLFYSAQARAQADWLLGLNATNALTIANQNRSVLSLGRVQTPTLTLIIERYLEHKNFIPKPYFLAKGEFIKDGIKFFAVSQQFDTPTDIPNLTPLQGSFFTIKDTDQVEASENAPLLHDLSSLQQLANKMFGMSADNVLQTMQRLYESKYITYPRTGSRYIGNDIFNEIPTLLQKIASSQILTDAQKYYVKETLLKNDLNKRSVNATKVTDHHAVLPTEYFPVISDLKNDEKQIYNLIVIRTLEAFSPKALKLKTRIILTAGDLELKATGTVIKNDGWLLLSKLFAIDQGSQSDNDQEENSVLPQVRTNEQIQNINLTTLNKKTKPKPLHTEGTLLKAMETSGKDIDDEDIRETMKDIGIGTPATRASIIETLFKRKYIQNDKKNLIPTELGLFVYSNIKHLDICKVILTGKWEQKLNEIEEGKITADVFDFNIRKFTEKITQDILGLEDSFKNAQIPGLITSNTKSEILCPKCKKANLIEGKTNYFCAGYLQNNCNFSIYKIKSEYSLTEANVKDLCEKGKTSTIKKFKSKNNKIFQAQLMLDQEFKVVFAFN